MFAKVNHSCYIMVNCSMSINMALSVHSVTQSMCDWDIVAPLEVITAYNFANSPKSSGGYESLVIFSTCSLEVCCFQLTFCL